MIQDGCPNLYVCLSVSPNAPYFPIDLIFLRFPRGSGRLSKLDFRIFSPASEVGKGVFRKVLRTSASWDVFYTVGWFDFKIGFLLSPLEKSLLIFFFLRSIKVCLMYGKGCLKFLVKTVWSGFVLWSEPGDMLAVAEINKTLFQCLIGVIQINPM